MAIKIEKSLRYRVNVSQTSTGKKSWDCTVEEEGSSQDTVLARSDELVKALEARYPPDEQKKPAEKPPKTPQHEGLGIPLGATP